MGLSLGRPVLDATNGMLLAVPRPGRAEPGSWTTVARCGPVEAPWGLARAPGVFPFSRSRTVASQLGHVVAPLAWGLVGSVLGNSGVFSSFSVCWTWSGAGAGLYIPLSTAGCSLPVG